MRNKAWLAGNWKIACFKRMVRQPCAAAQLGRNYAGRVERGEQNISMQSLIQIALTLKIEVGELFPPLRELKTPYRKRLEK